MLALAFIVATFGLNYQITMALMARQQFHLGAEAFGLMSTSLALGALVGSLLAARRRHVPLPVVVIAALTFASVEIVVGFAPTYLAMMVMLPFAGALAMTFTTAAQSYLQLNSSSWVRGRVMGIYTLVFFGGTPIGAPVIGWATDIWGPRSGLVGGGIGTLFFTLVALGVYAATRAGAPSEPATEDEDVAADEAMEVVDKASSETHG